MENVQIPTSLPKEFYRYFWDINAGKLDPAEHPKYVINRLLDKGDLVAARWVLRNFPNETIKETFRKIRDFSPWNGRFWASFLEIPEEEVVCLQLPYLMKRRQLWPF